MNSKLIFGLLLTGITISCRYDHVQRQYLTKQVIILVIDGARYTETWGDPTHQYIPNMAALAAEGSVFTNFNNNGITNTVNGHSALMTGYYDSLDNGGAEFPQYPSLMQYYREKYETGQNSCWIISSKDKLEVLGNCTDASYKNQFQPATNCGNSGLGTGYRTDTITFLTALDVLSSDHPSMAMINLKQPDSAAHAGSWAGYLQGIVDGDNYAAALWDYLQSDPFYAGTTALFITNDHGRHLDGWSSGFASHGDNCEGCEHIFLMALGPDFKQNFVETDFYDQTDVTATIANIFGLKMPNAAGDPIDSILK